MTKASWGGKGLGLCSHTIVRLWKKPGQELKEGRKLEAGVDAEAMEECPFLGCSVCFLVDPRTLVTQGWTTSRGLGPPNAGSYGGIFSIKVGSVLCHLTQS